MSTLGMLRHEINDFDVFIPDFKQFSPFLKKRPSQNNKLLNFYYRN